MTGLDSQRKWMLFALFATLFCTLGSIVNTIPIFITPLMKHYGWTHTQASAVPMAYSLTMGLGAPLVGLALDRIEARIVMTSGALVLASGLFLAGGAHSFVPIFIAHLLIGAGGAASSIVPGSLVAANWFADRRGLAIGVTIAGGSTGGVIMPPIIDRLLASSISTAYFTLALMVLLIPTTLILAFIRTRPANAVGDGAAERVESLPGLELGPALRTRQFWTLIAVQILASLGMFGTFFYMVPFLIQSGYASSNAALAMSLINVAAAAGLLVMGTLCDRFTGRKVLPLIALQLGLSTILLLGARAATGWPFYLGAFLLLFGLVVGFATIVPVVLVEIFGLKRFGTLSGLLGMASALAMAMGPMVVGVVFDRTNSYTTAFELSAMFCFLAAGAAFTLSPVTGMAAASPDALRSVSRH